MYPFNSLVVITPIVFFVLLAAFPLIGFFAGWKRAAYWGGGNLLFYIIGLIVWKTAGNSIAHALEPTVQAMLGDKISGANLTQLVNSVVTPFFFLIIIAIANITLVICYYAFAKRLMGLKKAKAVETKEYRKYNVNAKKLAEYDSKKVPNQKWFNRLVGSVGLGALMIPVTLTLTQATVLTTTNSATRKTNKLTSFLYDGLQGTASNISWFSYYNGAETGKDYDGLFSLIALNSSTIDYIEIETQKSTSGSAVDAISKTLSFGMNDLVKKTQTAKEVTVEGVTPVITSINNLQNSWDDIVSKKPEDLEILFNSSGITEVIKTLISKEVSTKVKIAPADVIYYQDTNGVYQKVLSAYTDPKPDQVGPEDKRTNYYIEIDGEKLPIYPIQQVITTSRAAFINVVDAIYDIYDVSSLNETEKTVLKDITTQQVQMFLRYN